MDEKQAQVSYFVYEGAMARMERIFRITVIALVTALAVAVGSLVVNDVMWRHHCRDLEDRLANTVEVQDGVYQQSDQGTH